MKWLVERNSIKIFISKIIIFQIYPQALKYLGQIHLDQWPIFQTLPPGPPKPVLNLDSHLSLKKPTVATARNTLWKTYIWNER